MQDKPRIAIVSRLYPRPDRPLTGTFNRKQFQGLAERFAVSLVVPVPLHERVLHRRELVPYRDGAIDVRYAAWAFPPRVGRPLYPACFGLSLLPELRRLRAERPVCLLVSWGYPDAVGMAALNRALGLPLIIKLHGSDINVHAADGKLQAAQLRWAARRAFAVVCVSEALRQRAIALGVPADKAVVVRNGVDTEHFRPLPREEARAQTGQPAQRRSVLFVGNVLATKGVRELLLAFEHVGRQIPDLDLVVIGEGAESDWLRTKAKAAGLDARVRLVGRVDHAALGPWFNAADLVCLPSHMEGLPNVLMEAMACGVPCVATRVGGIPEVVSEHSGELVPVHDVPALAAALRNVLERRWDRDAMVREAARFSWRASSDALAELIDRAAGAR
jgi:glycosyltransferase involved in cell wall biosynthesis